MTKTAATMTKTAATYHQRLAAALNSAPRIRFISLELQQRQQLEAIRANAARNPAPRASENASTAHRSFQGHESRERQ